VPDEETTDDRLEPLEAAWLSAIEEALRDGLASDVDADAAISNALDATLPRVTAEVGAELRRRTPELTRDLRRDRRAFEARLYRRWKKPIDQLEAIWNATLEAGQAFARRSARASSTADTTLGVLVQSHARACQITYEILALLRAGCASGAHARWRSLHEVAVTMMILRAHPKLTARYVDHAAVDRWRAARAYQAHAVPRGFEPISGEELERYERSAAKAVAAHGKAIEGPWGWAEPLFDKARFGFHDLERAAGVAHLNPWYGMANLAVHAHSRSLEFNLSAVHGADGVLVAGGTDAGLAEPGQGTALTLLQATSALVVYGRPSLDDVITLNVLSEMTTAVAEAFVATGMRLDHAPRTNTPEG
jgi:hypothetical protein